jgi:galactose mutarotase-like enzyme
MEIIEVNGSRFDLALERFKAGYPFNFRGVSFRLASDNSLEVSVQSSWQMENTTKDTALGDFKIARSHLKNSLINFTDGTT